jgi:ribonuclease BN (tRNA processing enzyme)
VPSQTVGTIFITHNHPDHALGFVDVLANDFLGTSMAQRCPPLYRCAKQGNEPPLKSKVLSAVADRGYGGLFSRRKETSPRFDIMHRRRTWRPVPVQWPAKSGSTIAYCVQVTPG